MMTIKSIGMALCSITAALSVLLTGAPEPDSAGLFEAESEGTAVSSAQSEISAPAEQNSNEEAQSSLPTEVVMEPEPVSSRGQSATSDSTPGEPAEDTDTTASEAVLQEVSTDLSAEMNTEDTAANEESASLAPALMSLDTPPYITDELAHLLATNQADSIMGSFGITRSEACSMVQAVFDVSDYSGKATVDANYAELWAALESEFRVLSEQGCEYTNCKFSDGIIILLK